MLCNKVGVIELVSHACVSGARANKSSYGMMMVLVSAAGTEGRPVKAVLGLDETLLGEAQSKVGSGWLLLLLSSKAGPWQRKTGSEICHRGGRGETVVDRKLLLLLLLLLRIWPLKDFGSRQTEAVGALTGLHARPVNASEIRGWKAKIVGLVGRSPLVLSVLIGTRQDLRRSNRYGGGEL